MNLVDTLLLLLLFLPLISVFAILLIKDNKIEAVKHARMVSLLTSVVSLLFTIYVFLNINYSSYQFLASYNFLNQVSINLLLGIDGISLLFLFITNFLFIVVFIFINLEKFTKNSFALLLLLEFSIIGTFISFNLWVFYIFFELAIFLIFFLMQNTKNLAYAQYKFLLFNLLGSLIMFVCIVYIVAVTDKANFPSLFSMTFSAKEQKILWWGLFLAFAIKSGVFPFHLWIKDIYSNSDNIINMILSAVLIKFGIYGFLRIVIPAFPLANLIYSEIAVILAIITALYAMFMAFSVDNIKSFLAYFSLSHVGIIILGIFSIHATGLSGAIFQSISHSIFMIGFILAFIIIEKRVNIVNFSSLSGLVSKMPFLALFFMIISLAGLSMPGTNAFMGEFLILQGTFNVFPILTVIATLTIIFSAAVVLTRYKQLMYGEISNNIISIKDINIIEFSILLIISIIIIATGIYPQSILNLLTPYVNQVIGFIKSQEVIYGYF